MLYNKLRNNYMLCNKVRNKSEKAVEAYSLSVIKLRRVNKCGELLLGDWEPLTFPIESNDFFTARKCRAWSFSCCAISSNLQNYIKVQTSVVNGGELNPYSGRIDEQRRDITIHQHKSEPCGIHHCSINIRNLFL